MKFLILTATFGLISILGYPQINSNSPFQRGYAKRIGTYHQSHFKIKTNKAGGDNYSANFNAYMEKRGSKAKGYSFGAYRYKDENGRIIHSGPNGGYYYYDSKGKKTYVLKR